MSNDNKQLPLLPPSYDKVKKEGQETEYYCPKCKTQTLVHPIIEELIDVPDRAHLVCVTCGKVFSKKYVLQQEENSEFLIQSNNAGEVEFDIDVLEGKIAILAENIVPPSISALRWILENHQALTFKYSNEKKDCILVDVQTANLLITIWDYFKSKAVDGKATNEMRRFYHMLTVSKMLFVEQVRIFQKVMK